MSKEVNLFEDGVEEYPLSTIFIENITLASWIAVGTVLMWFFMPVLAWIYLAFCSVMILFVMRIIVCKNCYYHGKWCHVGWGKLSARYCKQGDVEKFGCSFGIKFAPVFFISISLVPLVLGIVSTIKLFSFFKLGLLVFLVLNVFYNSVVLRKKSCALCKMRYECPGSAAK